MVWEGVCVFDFILVANSLFSRSDRGGEKVACDRCSAKPSLKASCNRLEGSLSACSRCSRMRVVCRVKGVPIRNKRLEALASGLEEISEKLEGISVP
jgi:hypothetical protein